MYSTASKNQAATLFIPLKSDVSQLPCTPTHAHAHTSKISDCRF